MISVKSLNALKAKNLGKPDTVKKVDEELFLTPVMTLPIPVPKPNAFKIPMKPQTSTPNKTVNPKK
jgi:hypothetical protein